MRRFIGTFWAEAAVCVSAERVFLPDITAWAVVGVVSTIVRECLVTDVAGWAFDVAVFPVVHVSLTFALNMLAHYWVILL